MSIQHHNINYTLFPRCVTLYHRPIGRAATIGL